MKKKYFLIFIIAIMTFTLVACTTNDAEQTEASAGSTQDEQAAPEANSRLLFEQTVSPNKEYVDSQEDIVNYTIEIYQNENNEVTVIADSNSPLFGRTQYIVESDKPISESDIDVEWTTMMGNSQATKDDQIAVAKISISQNGEVVSQRKINFATNAMEIIGDTIEQNKQ